MNISETKYAPFPRNKGQLLHVQPKPTKPQTEGGDLRCRRPVVRFAIYKHETRWLGLNVIGTL